VPSRVKASRKGSIATVAVCPARFSRKRLMWSYKSASGLNHHRTAKIRLAGRQLVAREFIKLRVRRERGPQCLFYLARIPMIPDAIAKHWPGRSMEAVLHSLDRTLRGISPTAIPVISELAMTGYSQRALSPRPGIFISRDSAVKTLLASRAKGRVDFTNGFGAQSQLWMLFLWELGYGWDG
jgi:hypothetical protein